MEARAVRHHAHDCVQFLQPRVAGCVSEPVSEGPAWLRYEIGLAHDGGCEYRRDLRRSAVRISFREIRTAPDHHDRRAAGAALLGVRLHAPDPGHGGVCDAVLRARGLGSDSRASERTVAAGDSGNLSGVRLPARQSVGRRQPESSGGDRRGARQRLRDGDGGRRGHGGRGDRRPGGDRPGTARYRDEYLATGLVLTRRMLARPGAPGDCATALIGSPIVTWSAAQYSAFEDERTRPVRDLLAALPAANASTAIDIGCGP